MCWVRATGVDDRAGGPIWRRRSRPARKRARSSTCRLSIVPSRSRGDEDRPGEVARPARVKNHARALRRRLCGWAWGGGGVARLCRWVARTGSRPFAVLASCDQGHDHHDRQDGRPPRPRSATTAFRCREAEKAAAQRQPRGPSRSPRRKLLLLIALPSLRPLATPGCGCRPAASGTCRSERPMFVWGTVAFGALGLVALAVGLGISLFGGNALSAAVLLGGVVLGAFRLRPTPARDTGVRLAQ